MDIFLISKLPKKEIKRNIINTYYNETIYSFWVLEPGSL